MFLMIDIHSHLLAGIDDGAEREEDTLRMAEIYKQFGFSKVVATPHINEKSGYFIGKSELEERCRSWNEKFSELGLELLVGAEYYLEQNFVKFAEKYWPLITINNSYFLLVELPVLFPPSGLSISVFEIRSRNQELAKILPFLRLILAHPERNEETLKNPELSARRLREQGIYIQINLGSLIGLYGKPVRKCAELFLKKRLVDLVATDAHSPDQLKMVLEEGLARLRKLVGDKWCRVLMEVNPSRVLAGEPLEPMY